MGEKIKNDFVLTWQNITANHSNFKLDKKRLVKANTDILKNGKRRT